MTSSAKKPDNSVGRWKPGNSVERFEIRRLMWIELSYFLALGRVVRFLSTEPNCLLLSLSRRYLNVKFSALFVSSDENRGRIWKINLIINTFRVKFEFNFVEILFLSEKFFFSEYIYYYYYLFIFWVGTLKWDIQYMYVLNFSCSSSPMPDSYLTYPSQAFRFRPGRPLLVPYIIFSACTFRVNDVYP